MESHPDMPPHSRLRKWTTTNDGEMKAFLAMTLNMGLMKHQNIQDYWSTSPVLSTPFFGSVMPRDRFLLIMSFLHLSNNDLAIPSGQDGYFPLQKLGTPYINLLQNFQSHYVPVQTIAIDEGMIPWRGNLQFRVYNPDKPVKYGIILYMLCDSSNGYCCRVEMYTGKEARRQVSQHGVTYDLVMRSMEPYLFQGCHLYVDNYFSSPILFWNLYMTAMPHKHAVH